MYRAKARARHTTILAYTPDMTDAVMERSGGNPLRRAIETTPSWRSSAAAGRCGERPADRGRSPDPLAQPRTRREVPPTCFIGLLRKPG